MLAAKELELQREKENVNALRWELMMVQGMGESAQKTIIEAVSSKVSEKLGTGLMATPDDPTWGDAEERGMTLAPIFMQNFGDFDSFSDECKSKAGGGDTPVTVDVVAQLVVDKAPGLRKDYIKSAIELLKTPGTGADGADALDVEALYKECRKPEYLGSVLRSMFSASGSKVAIAPTDADADVAAAAPTPAPAPKDDAGEAPEKKEAAAAVEEEEEEDLEETKDEGEAPAAGGEVDEAAAVEAQKDALAATTGEEKSAEEADAGPEVLVYDILTKDDIKQLGDSFNGEKVGRHADFVQPPPYVVVTTTTTTTTTTITTTTTTTTTTTGEGQERRRGQDQQGRVQEARPEDLQGELGAGAQGQGPRRRVRAGRRGQLQVR